MKASNTRVLNVSEKAVVFFKKDISNTLKIHDDNVKRKNVLKLLLYLLISTKASFNSNKATESKTKNAPANSFLAKEVIHCLKTCTDQIQTNTQLFRLLSYTLTNNSDEFICAFFNNSRAVYNMLNKITQETSTINWLKSIFVPYFTENYAKVITLKITIKIIKLCTHLDGYSEGTDGVGIIPIFNAIISSTNADYDRIAYYNELQINEQISYKDYASKTYQYLVKFIRALENFYNEKIKPSNDATNSIDDNTAYLIATINTKIDLLSKKMLVIGIDMIDHSLVKNIKEDVLTLFLTLSEYIVVTENDEVLEKLKGMDREVCKGIEENINEAYQFAKYAKVFRLNLMKALENFNVTFETGSFIENNDLLSHVMKFRNLVVKIINSQYFKALLIVSDNMDNYNFMKSILDDM